MTNGSKELPYLKLTGGELTGPVSTTETEFEENDLVNKRYVDESVASVYPTEIVQGNPVICEDGAEYGLQGLKIFGKSTQKTTTGAQLIPLTLAASSAGLIVEHNDDGSLRITGTPLVQYENILNKELRLDPGTYCISGGSTNTGGIETQVRVEKSSGTNYYSRTSFTIDGTENHIYVNIQYNNSSLEKVNYDSYAPMLNKGTSALPFEPYTGGKPSPSPDYPQEIVSAGDRGSTELNITGANLLPLPDRSGTEVGINFEIKNGVVKTDGINTSGPISLWGGYVNTSPVFYLGPGKYSLTYGFTMRNFDGSTRTWFSGTFNLDKVTAITDVAIVTNNSINGYLYPMLNFGASVLPWEPYTGQLLPLSAPTGLPGIPVDSGGNYTDADGQQWVCDEIDLALGVYVQRVERITFDGSSDELWEMVTNTATQRNYFRISLKKTALRNDLNDNALLCQAFTYASPGGDNTTCFESNNLSFTCSTSLFDSVDDWRQYLTGNAMMLIYAIATPIETPLSEEEIAAYKALHTYDGTTTISTLEDVSGIEVQYLKKNRALPASSKQDAGRVVTVNDQGQFSLTDKYLDGVDLDSIFSLFIDGKNTTEMFWKWYPLTYKYGSTKYSRLERWCKLLANAWSNKTYTLRFYKASVSGDYTGTPLDDLADGRQAAPLVTDSSEPTEDWAENDPMTWYIRANALSLADGTMDILYFEGEDRFDITGEIAPVYCFALNLYLKHWTDDSYKYTSWKTIKADGYNSMAEGIAPDGTYRTITWHPAFYGGLNTSGGMTSGINKKPMVWTSSNNALPLAREIT